MGILFLKKVTCMKDICICMYVFWPSFRTPFQNYEVVDFQYQAVDITSLGCVYPSSTFSTPPTLNMHTSDKTRRTKDRNGHIYGLQFGQLVCPNNLGTKYSDYSLKKTRYEQRWHGTNDKNYNIQGQRADDWGGLGTAVIRITPPSVDRPRDVFSDGWTPR